MAAAAADKAAFVAFQNREHLDFLLNAAHGTRWSIGPVRTPSLDLYSAVAPSTIKQRCAPDTRANWHSLSTHSAAAAGADKGWLMIERRAAARDESTAGVELRAWTWAALSRGARGVIFGDWRARSQDERGALVEADGSITPQGRAAGALARIVGRNAVLFASLRPRPASVAIVYDPRPGASGEAARSTELLNVYTTLFRRNIAVDLLHLDAISPEAASRYKAIFVGPLSALPATVAMTLKRFAEAGGVLVTDAGALSEERLVEASTRAKLAPEARIEGSTGGVETRFLESHEVAMIIAINHADSPQRVTMTFAPDVQEAIWQNMETGAAVNFIAGPDGPRYTYNFGPRDALVLMIRKAMR